MIQLFSPIWLFTVNNYSCEQSWSTASGPAARYDIRIVVQVYVPEFVEQEVTICEEPPFPCRIRVAVPHLNHQIITFLVDIRIDLDPDGNGGVTCPP